MPGNIPDIVGKEINRSRLRRNYKERWKKNLGYTSIYLQSAYWGTLLLDPTAFPNQFVN